MNAILNIEKAYVEFFNAHLAIKTNKRILFSAPYGQGKTTFLGKFFLASEYTPIKLFPVNYSVSSNEDIFQLIKHDILFQILNQDINFEKTIFSHLDTLGIYYSENKQDIINTLIDFIPKTRNPVFDSVSNIYKAFKAYDKFRKKIKISDEKQDILNFLKESKIRIGSIYEEDFITLMINDFLARLKNPVLVIDDLDRLDPEHIFRILNVFSSHFDRPNKQDKFNFSKVIIVCDIKNIKHIYHHKYGIQTDFHGYIDKFFSKEVFHFANYDLLRTWISNIFKELKQNTNISLDSEDELFMNDILTCFVKYNILSFRDIDKINLDYNAVLKTINSFTEPNFMSLRLHRVIGLLKSIIGDLDMLDEKLKILSNKHGDVRQDFDVIDIKEAKYHYKHFIFPVLAHKTHSFKLDHEVPYIDNHAHASVHLILRKENGFYYTDIPYDYKNFNNYFWIDLKRAIKILREAEVIR